jgi:hypothetical protein
MKKSRSRSHGPARVKSVVALAVAAVLSIPCTAWSQQPAEQGRARSPERAAAQRQGLVSRIWWNQDAKVQELSLTAEQRKKMDAALTSFLDQRIAFQKEQRDALAAFGEALERGDTAGARTRSRAAGLATAKPVELQLEMMMTVVGFLTEEQRTRLTTNYPNMLSRLWVRASGPRLSLDPSSGPRRGQPR